MDSGSVLGCVFGLNVLWGPESLKYGSGVHWATSRQDSLERLFAGIALAGSGRRRP